MDFKFEGLPHASGLQTNCSNAKGITPPLPSTMHGEVRWLSCGAFFGDRRLPFFENAFSGSNECMLF
jgi:hypothetical protein